MISLQVAQAVVGREGVSTYMAVLLQDLGGAASQLLVKARSPAAAAAGGEIRAAVEECSVPRFTNRKEAFPLAVTRMGRLSTYARMDMPHLFAGTMELLADLMEEGNPQVYESCNFA